MRVCSRVCFLYQRIGSEVGGLHSAPGIQHPIDDCAMEELACVPLLEKKIGLPHFAKILLSLEWTEAHLGES